jgi:RHS repeat-associated protein
VPDENPSALGAFEFPLRFPGQYFDRETSLQYNYFRDFDPGLGRYVKSDPIGLHGGLNMYVYAKSAPLIVIDSTGLWTLQLGGSFGAVTPIGVAWNLGGGIAIDAHGNVGTYGSASFGAGEGAAAGTGVSAAISTADTIGGLRGISVTASGVGGAGAGGSIDVSGGSDPDTSRAIISVGGTVGIGGGVGGFIGGNQTFVSSIGSIQDFIRGIGQWLIPSGLIPSAQASTACHR